MSAVEFGGIKGAIERVVRKNGETRHPKHVLQQEHTAEQVAVRIRAAAASVIEGRERKAPDLAVERTVPFIEILDGASRRAFGRAYTDLSLTQKLDLLAEQAKHTKGGDQVGIQQKLVELRRIFDNQTATPDQWQAAQKVFSDSNGVLKRVYDLPEDVRPIVQEAQHAVFTHVINENNAPVYGITDPDQAALDLGYTAVGQRVRPPRGGTRFTFFDASAPGAPGRGSPLRVRLENVQTLFDTDPTLINDPKVLGEEAERLARDSVRLRRSSEAKPYILRLRQRQVTLAQLHQEELAKGRGRMGEINVTWEEARQTLPPDLQNRDQEITVLPLTGFTSDEKQLILTGEEGEAKWFSEFIFDIYGVGRTSQRPELPDMYKFEAFKRFMKMKYGDRIGTIRLQPYEYLWKDRGRHEYLLKALAYDPGDVKDKVGALQRMLGADLDFWGKVPLANMAMSHYDTALGDMVANKMSRYHQAVEYLAKEVQPYWETNPTKKITMDEYYMEMRRRDSLNQLGTTQQEITERKLLMENIKTQAEIVARGVTIHDEDILVYTEVGNQWIALQQKYDDLIGKREKGVSLDRDEQKLLKRLPELITEKKELYTRLSDKQTILPSDAKKIGTLDVYRSYSPIEAEVHERMVAEMLSQGMTRQQIADQEWKIRDAIFAARMIEIGSGHIAAISAYQAIRPMHEKYRFRTLRESGIEGKSVMWAPFMEDIVRIYNPELFAHRFNMGGLMGEQARAMLREKAILERGFKITKTQAWKDDEKSYSNSPEMMRMRKIMEFAEGEMGVSFTELLGPGFLAGGGSFDATGWRFEAGTFDEIRKHIMAKHGSPLAWENQALGIQFYIAQTDAERMQVLDRMLKRTPSKYLQLLSGEVMDGILEKNHVLGAPEWLTFQRALSIAEQKIRKGDLLIDPNLNLMSQEGFDAHIKPLLAQLKVPEDKIAAFRNVMKDVHSYVTTDRDPKNHQYLTPMEAWAHAKFPITLSVADFDWEEVNFFKLGTSVMLRRGRDMINMAAIRDLFFDLINKPEFLSPKDPKETIKKFYEFKQQFVSYASSVDAEKALYHIVDTWIEMNRNRMFNPFLDGWRGLLGLVPGLQGIMQNIGEMEAEHLPVLGWFPGWKHFLEHNKLGRKIKEWPESIASSVSLSVRYLGPEGNKWDEHTIGEVLNEIQRVGVFTDIKYINKLRRDFKATLGWRMSWGIFRKYWWVIPVATLAVATNESIQEEQKSSRH
ncbi:hypothetical protein M1555_04215 [Patescibacteria group bacterium]|nr:hypothetical protein [Patescibacteria group bacterium]